MQLCKKKGKVDGELFSFLPSFFVRTLVLYRVWSEFAPITYYAYQTSKIIIFFKLLLYYY